MKRVAILQSNYIPWKGYFDIIHRVDEFVLFDEAQYTVNDWRNRNRIKDAAGRASWLTIPVSRRNHLGRPISQATVADPKWARRHWDKLRDCYRGAPWFELLGTGILHVYQSISDEVFLSRINHRLIVYACALLGIQTTISWSTEYPGEGRKTDRLVSICEQTGADAYLSGPAARAYIDESEFERRGIALEWMEYQYPGYPQAGEFCHEVSILDLLFNTGPDAAGYIWGDRQRRVA